LERATDLPHRPQPKLSVVECPMCRTVVPVEQLAYFSGRKMCRNCVAGWFDDDDVESDDKRDAS
jgi:formylmethanofuran dehydrogenase subunit E